MERITTENFGDDGLVIELVDTMTAEISAGEGVIERGQEIGVNYTTGEWEKWDKTATDGTEEIRGIVLKGGDATTSKIKVLALTKGRVRADNLKTVEATDYKAVIQAYDKGITI